MTRSATSRKPLSNAITVDVLVVPGGIPVDEPLVRIPELWNSEGKPLAASDVGIQLQPTRHVPGYDLIESEVTLDYVSVKRETNSACRGSARTRAVLVDKDGVRQPLWDLGFSSAANAPRVQWLALRDAHSGAFPSGIRFTDRRHILRQLGARDTVHQRGALSDRRIRPRGSQTAAAARAGGSQRDGSVQADYLERGRRLACRSAGRAVSDSSIQPMKREHWTNVAACRATQVPQATSRRPRTPWQ